MEAGTRTTEESRLLEEPAVAAVAAALESLRSTGRVQILPPGLRTPTDVAEHLGVPRAALATCVLLVPPPAPAPQREPWYRTHLWSPRPVRGEHDAETAVLVVTSCIHRVVPEQVADVLGMPALEVAGTGPDGTGSAAIAPLGQPVPMTTLVDVALAPQSVVWVGAGHPRAVFPTRYDELLRLTGGQPVEVG
ncbi:prolyl-tRNA editing enzyme YbaK/EbsC (Cys-tRNA(Pro) deacylase) [Kineococcus xinjiangensis]|uniref:Prolyl-tRNA editing enzyme YbaK/EbsC (Cys-tRNA(Pro) deacylase) n=1 Tax=Kineococcus xinjiangensis TaxID=512762 RepID=A0A2S6ILZ7_9ACTN|nr:hypothetical protein [Kineococcus xinjiangensis]PPK95257.1 prolyl-tRNA editing enzyme YbaK/EbsC (Cys-tRNA(Pro) deacylase) [Kineococcus xinjiangensis]